jgi:hypothetical protein
MQRAVMLLAALCGLSALGGCVGYVPVAVPVHGGHEGRYDSPPPRAYHDRDGDGVPNRYDRRPDNPYRY